MVVPPELFQLRAMAGADEDAEERRLLGRALALLRSECGLTQEAAGEAFGASGQNWQKYEAGRAPSIFKPAVQRRLVQALGANLHDLALARERVLAADRAAGATPLLRGVSEPGAGALEPMDTRWRSDEGAGRKLAALCASDCRTLQMPDDQLRPWAVSGATIVYDPRSWPRQEEGCVVETEDGRLYVKIFVRADADAIHLRELHPGPRELSFPRTPGIGVYRVVARID